MNQLYKSDKFRWFISLLSKDSNLLFASLAIGLISSGINILMAVFSQKLIDNIIPSKDMVYFYQAIGLLILLLLFKLAVGYAQSFVSALHGKRFNLRLINAFFSKLIFLPKSFFDANKTGTLITRMHDSSAIHGTVIFVCNVLILNFLNLIVSASFLFHYSTYIGFLSFTALPLYFISSLFFKNMMRSRLQHMYVANGETESNYIASIKNIDLIKTHNKQEHYAAQNFEKYGNSVEKTFQSGLTGINFGLSSESIGSFCYVVILALAAYQSLAGHMTIGEFTATLTIATGMLGPMSVLGNALMHLQGARVAFDRMYEIMSAESEFNKDADAKKDSPGHINRIELVDVAFSYDIDITLLKNINFSACSGEMVCIYGRNGAGKSTLINLLVGLYHPVKGDILLNGKKFSELSIMEIRKRIAVVSQQTKLFDGSLMQNVCMSANENEIYDACVFLSQYGFDPFIERINGGYHAVVHEDGNNLSGGQKQIIALARALYKRPDVLLVDEATAALDADSEKFVINILQKFADGGGIVIMVSHRLKPAKASSKIIIIDQSTVQQIGDHHSLMHTQNLYSKRYQHADARQNVIDAVME